MRGLVKLAAKRRPPRIDLQYTDEIKASAATPGLLFWRTKRLAIVWAEAEFAVFEAIGEIAPEIFSRLALNAMHPTVISLFHVASACLKNAFGRHAIK